MRSVASSTIFFQRGISVFSLSTITNTNPILPLWGIPSYSAVSGPCLFRNPHRRIEGTQSCAPDECHKWGQLLICRLLAANLLNQTPKNVIREVFFFFSWIFSSAGGVLFPAQIFEDQRRRGRSPTRWILLFYFPSPRIRSKGIGPRAPPNSSCDDICFVLASLSNEVRSNTPHHSTPHTRDTLKMGRDWPVMSRNRQVPPCQNQHIIKMAPLWSTV